MLDPRSLSPVTDWLCMAEPKFAAPKVTVSVYVCKYVSVWVCMYSQNEHERNLEIMMIKFMIDTMMLMMMIHSRRLMIQGQLLGARRQSKNLSRAPR